ncbi:MAG TPA: anti-sigma factor [Polyangia bacterium]|jgi:anti-sigma-K factor RskA|nr:anti-sigma factor [Polyangia bacterium]
MTCEEFLELAAAYTLGIVDEAEHAACTAHLGEPTHRGCLEAATEARDISAKLAVTVPARPPSADLWPAIETRIAAGDSGTPMNRPATGARPWRELAGWFVAAAVLGFHLYNVPADPKRMAAAGQGSRGLLSDSGTQAISLMVAPGTRLSAFAGGRDGSGASIMLNVAERRAIVVARAKKTEPPEGLRLWTVRGDRPPTSLGMLISSSSGAVGDSADLSAASLGMALFDPALPDKLLISVDTPEASAPQAVLLSAALH